MSEGFRGHPGWVSSEPFQGFLLGISFATSRCLVELRDVLVLTYLPWVYFVLVLRLVAEGVHFTLLGSYSL